MERPAIPLVAVVVIMIVVIAGAVAPGPVAVMDVNQSKPTKL